MEGNMMNNWAVASFWSRIAAWSCRQVVPFLHCIVCSLYESRDKEQHSLM